MIDSPNQTTAADDASNAYRSNGGSVGCRTAPNCGVSVGTSIPAFFKTYELTAKIRDFSRTYQTAAVSQQASAKNQVINAAAVNKELIKSISGANLYRLDNKPSMAVIDAQITAADDASVHALKKLVS